MSEERNRRRIDEQKEIFDSAIQEWLEKKFAQFGKWTFCSFMAIIFVLIIRMLICIGGADVRNIIDTAEQIRAIAK